MRFRSGRFARPADAALGVADYAAIEIECAGRGERLERKNDGCGVAAGIGDEARACYAAAMQLGHAVDGLRLRGCGPLGAVVFKFVDGAVGSFMETPCAAQIDDAEAALERFRNPLARLLVRSGEKQYLDSAGGEQLPRERLLHKPASAVVVGELGMNLRQGNASARKILFVDAPGKDGRRGFKARMVQEKARQLCARVACHSHHSSLDCAGHDSRMVLSRASTAPARRGSGQIT